MDELSLLLTRVLKNRTPYDFQIEAGKRILAGENLVLRAPTGCGKTISVLAPFIIGWKAGRWRRLIYALPLRALANSIFAEAKRAIKDADLDGKCNVTIQTGEQPEDPFFALGDIIITTYDQLLSGLLSNPYGLGRNLHNVNSAAVAGALVVFDEFHLMEPGIAFMTAAAGLRLFRDMSQSVWMTATATSALTDLLEDALDTVTVCPGEAELREVPAVRRVQRTLAVEKHALTAAEVMARHKNQTLIVTNQVRWAQELFEGIEGIPNKMLLHSRFFKEDRSQKEQWLRERLGPGSNWSGIVVATQVVEAGLDITCDQLHTVLCPMNAFVQRAGRNVRFPPEDDGACLQGTVSVWPLPGDPNPWLPYDRSLLERTWEVLAENDGAILDPTTLAEWVETVHAPLDTAELSASWRPRLNTCVEIIHKTSIKRENVEVAPLIREVDRVRVIIAAAPPASPFERDGLALRRDALKRAVPQGGDAARMWAWYPGDTDAAPWRTVTEGKDLDGACYNFCINPSLAEYTPEVGLVLGQPGSIESPRAVRPERPGYAGLGKEKWTTHSNNVAKYVSELGTEQLAPDSILAHGLESRYQLGFEAMIAALSACGLLHDLGKLQSRWQRWAEAYQSKKETNYRHIRALAHTDYDGKNQRDQEISRAVTSELGTRGAHAAPGAFLALYFLPEIIKYATEADKHLALVITAAIVSHHGGWIGSEAGPAALWNGWPSEVGDLLGRAIAPRKAREIEQAFRENKKSDQLESALTEIVHPDQVGEYWPLLSLVVRTLRLSDQKATAESLEGEP